MAFDDQLRSYLDKVERRVVGRLVDEDDLRSHFLGRLREDRSPPEVVQALFDEWSPKLGRFARYISALPNQVAPVKPDEALMFARRALDVAMGLSDRLPALVDRLEMRRIVDGFETADDLETYAIENRLVRSESPDRVRITDLARVFLRLRGKDAVRWLLTVEAIQSRGAFDRWRSAPGLLQEAYWDPGIETIERDGEESLPCAHETLQRLVSLGVLARRAGDWAGKHQYLAQKSMHDVIQAVVEEGPWHAAAAALIEDERAVALPGLGRTAIDATIEQTRMVAHEIRNALIPARHHIDALSSAIADLPYRGRLDAARRGVVRVLSFVDELVAIGELVDEPATLFDIADAVREALGWVDGSERIELVAEASVRVRAPRSRLARAISNLALNALQATSESQRVRVTTRRTQELAEIVVDDAGPGVPPELQGRIFDDGFTTRTGGSGFGLAFARSVVERLRGKVWCEASDLGGARFVIAMEEALEP